MTEDEAEIKAVEQAHEAAGLIDQIKPMLAGKGPAVQSCVLADLLSIWVVGFEVPGDVAETAELQANNLARHMQLVMDLIAERCRS